MIPIDQITKELLNCVVCNALITQKEHDKNNGMCNYCYEVLIANCLK